MTGARKGEVPEYGTGRESEDRKGGRKVQGGMKGATKGEVPEEGRTG